MYLSLPEGSRKKVATAGAVPRTRTRPLFTSGRRHAAPRAAPMLSESALIFDLGKVEPKAFWKSNPLNFRLKLGMFFTTVSRSRYTPASSTVPGTEKMTLCSLVLSMLCRARCLLILSATASVLNVYTSVACHGPPSVFVSLSSHSSEEQMAGSSFMFSSLPRPRDEDEATPPPATPAASGSCRATINFVRVPPISMDKMFCGSFARRSTTFTCAGMSDSLAISVAKDSRSARRCCENSSS
mmetsp:Transcript_11006/g.21078  ORF Transcript_11006/g.21078 Transcript_11006/m.21078 type:complete len:241 (+) Transcript_11006:813-1535(+)